MDIDTQIESLFKNFRIKCDMALSERDDKFYTQAEYEKAIQWELNYATKAIKTLLIQSKIDELERLNTRRHYGKDYQDSLDALDEYKDDRISALQKKDIK